MSAKLEIKQETRDGGTPLEAMKEIMCGVN